MINVTSAETVRFGYYLISPVEEAGEVDGFIMPEGENSKLALGEIILSGGYFYSQGESFDLDFNEGEIVVYRDSGNIKIKVDGSECLLVPHENVFVSVTQEEEIE